MNKKIRVLVVEDEVVISFLMDRMLRTLGCEVVEIVVFAEAAAPAYQKHLPDLVLMDIRLAGPMNGLAAAREILAIGPAKIAFMTAYGTRALIDEIASIANLGYYEKPVSIDTLRKILDLLEKASDSPPADSRQ